MPRRTEFERKGTFEFKHVCPYCNYLNESLDKDHIGVIKCEDCNREYYVITEEMVAYNIYKKTAPVQHTTNALSHTQSGTAQS